MSDQPQDVLIFLGAGDLIGRGARKRKGSVYTRENQLCIGIWTDPAQLEGVKVGHVEYTSNAARSYLWHRREKFDEAIASARALASPS